MSRSERGWGWEASLLVANLGKLHPPFPGSHLATLDVSLRPFPLGVGASQMSRTVLRGKRNSDSEGRLPCSRESSSRWGNIWIFDFFRRKFATRATFSMLGTSGRNYSVFLSLAADVGCGAREEAVWRLPSLWKPNEEELSTICVDLPYGPHRRHGYLSAACSGYSAIPPSWLFQAFRRVCMTASCDRGPSGLRRLAAWGGLAIDGQGACDAATRN